MSVFSYPKINLALDVLGETQSGYHEIQTVFHQFDEPADEIILENSTGGLIELNSDCAALPKDKTNTVFKAALLLQKVVGVSNGAKIFIKKRIPLMSGLGGGSSNAVAALKALARLWGIDCCHSGDCHSGLDSESDKILKQGFDGAQPDIVQDDAHAPNCLLRKLANQIGMDCVFFFNGGTALGTHFGEKIHPLPPLPNDLKFTIIPTGAEVSSRMAYESLKIIHCGVNCNKTERLLSALRRGDSHEILNNIHNDFEEAIFEKFPQILAKKREIESSQSGKVILCGSGGCLARVIASRF